MEAELDVHIHLITRFARLDAPSEYLERELELALDASSAQQAEERVRALLDAYRSQKEPLIATARELLPRVLRSDRIDVDEDPCYLVQRAAREGWPVKDATKQEELLDIARRCDALDGWLQEQLYAVLAPAS